jgi:DNA repair protein RecO (recombination protein O)
MRVVLQPAYVLQIRSYRESSALVEAFTQDYGRVGLVAKGVRRRRSKAAGLLQPFRPLLLSWLGRGELVTLIGVEASGPIVSGLAGEGLLCAFYLNELLLRLLARQDPFESLFSSYARSLPPLINPQQRQQALRLFERDLLKHLGYGLLLDYEANTRRPIQAEQWYSYRLEQGPEPLQTEISEGIKIRGRTLQALARGALIDATSLCEAKRLLRSLLAFHLGGKPLKSRELWHELRRLSNADLKEAKEHDSK